MGSALARAISATDHHLTVWNRSEAKSDAMRKEGAEVAESVADAVSKSQVVVVCVRGYDTATSLFQNPEIEPLLEGKTIIQLGNGVPTEVTQAAGWFSGNGAAYLDGSIMAFPDAVGSAECQVLVSGDADAFERSRRIFDAIGGDIRFLSTDPAASAVINSSGLAFLYVAAHAFVSAAALCDAADAPLDLLADVVSKFMPQMPLVFAEYVSMISTGTYESTNLRLASGTEALAAITEFGDSMGVDVKLFQSALSTFQDAIEADAGVNLAAIFEVLKQR